MGNHFERDIAYEKEQEALDRQYANKIIPGSQPFLLEREEPPYHDNITYSKGKSTLEISDNAAKRDSLLGNHH